MRCIVSRRLFSVNAALPYPPPRGLAPTSVRCYYPRMLSSAWFGGRIAAIGFVASALIPSDGFAANWRTEDVYGTPAEQWVAEAYAGGGRFFLAYSSYGLQFLTFDGLTWATETVDPDICFDDRGLRRPDRVSMLVTSTGDPVIAYRDPDRQAVKLARRLGAAWAVETVDNAGASVGNMPSLALDSADNPWLAYATDGNVWLARWSGASWTQELVADGEGTIGLTVDDLGNATIGYWGGSPRLIRIARWTGSWQFDSLTVGDMTFPHWFSMAADSAGNLAITYIDNVFTLPEVGLARWNRVSWSFEVVAQLAAGSYGHTTAAFDSQDRLGVAYNANARGASFAAWDGTAWQSDVVSSSYGVTNIALAFDETDAPSLAFRAANDGIWRSSKPGATWQRERVKHAGSQPTSWVSVDIDPSGELSVTLFDGSIQELRHAGRVAGTWSSTRVASFARERTTMAFDSNSTSEPQIGFAKPNSPSDTVSIGRWDGSAWQVEEIGVFGDEPSLVFDPLGQLAVSYHDAVNDTLGIARFDGLVWQFETVDPTPGSGWSSTLAFNSAGHPVIAYLTGSVAKVASWDGMTWAIETVATGVGVRAFVYGGLASVLDRDDRPVLAFFDEAGFSLRVARWLGGAWTSTLVDAGAWGYSPPSLRLAPGTRWPVIAYSYGSLGPLIVARYDGTRYNRESVAPEVERYVSLALDYAGRASIAYVDPCRGLARVVSESSTGALHRGAVTSLAPGWRATALPLTSLNDDETSPFPIATIAPGGTADIAVPAEPLTLYRVLAAGDQPLGNVVRATKAAGGIQLAY